MWILQKPPFKIKSPKKIFDENSKVRKLVINEELNCQNKNFIYKILNKDEAFQFCIIPLSRRGAEDKAIWGYKNESKFSVQSAYHLGRLRQRKNYGEPSNRHAQKYIWYKIWKLNIPGAAK